MDRPAVQHPTARAGRPADPPRACCGRRRRRRSCQNGQQKRTTTHRSPRLIVVVLLLSALLLVLSVHRGPIVVDAAKSGDGKDAANGGSDGDAGRGAAATATRTGGRDDARHVEQQPTGTAGAAANDGALGAAAVKARQTLGHGGGTATAAAIKKKAGQKIKGGSDDRPTNAAAGDGDAAAAAAAAMDNVKHGPPPLEKDGRRDRSERRRHGAAEESSDSDDGGDVLTQHGRDNLETYVDMSDLDLGSKDPAEAARLALDRMSRSLERRMTKMFAKAKTEECRALIGEHFGYFVNAIGVEGSMPFMEEQFYNECPEEKYDFDYLPEGMSIGDVQNRTYQPPRNETEYLEDPADLKLLYAILTHYDPNATVRLIEALHEPGYTFVVHVDGKESADGTYNALAEYASTRDHVHVLPHPYRVRVNWGGFSMVNATMQILRFAFALDGAYPTPNSDPLDFHKFVHLASTSYPIASNAEIRHRIASYPLDANFVNVVFKPNSPSAAAWNYFVECDDALHRIYRLTPLDDLNWGIDIYTSSQWFVISREFALYVAEAKPGTLVHDLLEYVEHVVVADESFFGTALRHSKFCTKHHNSNFLHVQFDRWENEIDVGERDERKCVMADPNHCGRSPTTMTVDYLPILELSGDLFARKFLDEVDPRIKDVIDVKRAREEEILRSVDASGGDGLGEVDLRRGAHVDTSFEGHGVLIVARETLYDDVPQCLGLGRTRNRVRLFPCFVDGVPPTLAPGWETGAVIEEETLMHNRWDIGPCSSDGNLERTERGEFNVTPGLYSKTGPSCLLKQRDGLRAGRCVDIESERLRPGGKLHVFPCVKRWSQFVSFGDGSLTPKGSIHASVPLHIIKRIESKGRAQEQHLCFGAAGRGKPEEDEWEEDAELAETKADANDTDSIFPDTNETNANGTLPLRLWSGKQLITTPCSNVDAVIEWIFIPYIVEDEEAGASDQENAADGEEEEL